MKYSLLFTIIGTIVLSGCAEKQLIVNGMICPEGHSQEQVKADFSACRYYNLDDATKASNVAPECKECLEKKGYKIEK